MTEKITAVSVWGYLREYREIVERHRVEETGILEEILFALQQSGLNVDLDLCRIQVEASLNKEIIELREAHTKTLRKCTALTNEACELDKRIIELRNELKTLKGQ